MDDRPMTEITTKPQPTARILRDAPGVQTIWLIEMPAPRSGPAKQYRATTYPNSNLIYLESSERKRAIAPGNATKLLPPIRAAIEKARAAQ